MTRIIATLGPASYSHIEELHDALLFFRFNFSHFVEKDFQMAMGKICDKKKILADLQGPKMRIGYCENKTLLKNSPFVFYAQENNKHDGVVLSHFSAIPPLEKNQKIYLDDGKLCVSVLAHHYDAIETVVEVGGGLTARKGVNIPGVTLSLSCVTEKDHQDIAFCQRFGVDHFALSFVQHENDITVFKKQYPHAVVFAKIETAQAVERMDEIIRVTDGVLIARGDLGVEVPFEKVPKIQARLVELCRHKNKPVIVATHMLESMISCPLPTRAEVSDIMLAVQQGANALMLSAETAHGAYPLEAIHVMQRIIKEGQHV